MKIILILLIMFPLFAKANFCKQESGLLKQWREQKSWKEIVTQPSSKNSNISYKVYDNGFGKKYIENFNIKGDFNADLSVDINSTYTKDIFLNMCDQNENNGQRLSNSRKYSGNKNNFRLSLNYMPIFDFNETPSYNHQIIKTNPGGIGVSINLKNASMFKNNSWQYESELKNIRTSIESSLAEQINLGFNGKVEINLDHMDDLVCDLMRGEAEIEFYHLSLMESPLVELSEAVVTNDVIELYEIAKKSSLSTNDKNYQYYSIGRGVENLLLNKNFSITTDIKIFKVLNQFFDPTTNKINKLNSEQFTCLAENESSYQKNIEQNRMILNIKVPNITKMIGE